VVLVTSIRQAECEGLPPREAIVKGCEIRFRAIIVWAIVTVIGFLPTVLTLLVLPAIYALRRERAAGSEPSPVQGFAA
jgi:Cu/Ag efflux pump CusA